MGDIEEVRQKERFRLFCEVYIEAFRKNGKSYTEGTYAREALAEFDRSFPPIKQEPRT